MARRPREDVEGCLFHVISRGNNRQKIFLDKEDYRHYLSKVRFYQNKFSITIYACCLMPNHVHFLVKRGEQPLSKFMQGLQQSYALYFHKKYKRVGHLFQGRYKAILCDGDAYFLELVRYIHLNPVRSKIVAKGNDYLWSSHQAFRGNRDWNFIETQTTLSELGGARGYFRFMNSGVPEEYREDLHEIKNQLYLGDDRFVEGMEDSRQQPVFRRWNISLAQLAHEVERYHDLERGSLQSPSRMRRLTPARDGFLYLNHALAGFPLKEVASFLGRDPSRLSRQWNLFLERSLKDPKQKRKMEELARRIQKYLALFPKKTQERNKSINQV